MCRKGVYKVFDFGRTNPRSPTCGYMGQKLIYLAEIRSLIPAATKGFFYILNLFKDEGQKEKDAAEQKGKE